jgi:FMN phosphatase YigB (HAD superfamily)
VATIFFDLGDTLVRASLGGAPPRLRFTPLEFAAGLLARLRTAGHRLGIISNTGNLSAATVDAALAEIGLLDPFDPGLRIYSGDFPDLQEKPAPDLFEEAMRRALVGERVFFVGENAAERATAAALGFEPAAPGALDALPD